MNLLLASLVVVAFAVGLEALGLPDRAREAGRRAGRSLDVLRDTSLDDDAKEEALQREALRLFGLVGWLAGGGLLSLGLPLAAVWLLERLGVGSLETVLATLERPAFLVGATLLGSGAYLVARRLGAR